MTVGVLRHMCFVRPRPPVRPSMRNHGRSDGRVHQLLLLVVKETEKERKKGAVSFLLRSSRGPPPISIPSRLGGRRRRRRRRWILSVRLLRSLPPKTSRTIFAQRVSGRVGVSERASKWSAFPSCVTPCWMEDRGHFLNRHLDRRPQQSHLMLIRCLRRPRPSPSRNTEEER